MVTNGGYRWLPLLVVTTANGHQCWWLPLLMVTTAGGYH